MAARASGTRPVVVVIDNYDSFTFNLVHQLICDGCAVEVVRNDEVTAGQVAAFGPAGILISPGPCAPEDAGISVDVVRACAAGIPILGVCLGHQAIAACYGARIVAAPRPVHGQTATIVHDGRGLLAGLPQRFPATRYHSLVVDEHTLPSFLTVTARTRGGIPMGLRHATLPVEGVQFHPESILTSHGQMIITSFARRLRLLAQTSGEQGITERAAEVEHAAAAAGAVQEAGVVQGGQVPPGTAASTIRARRRSG
jgi:anthranilate synthase component 2